MAKKQDTAKVRITDQFRSGQSMVYDLKCDGVRLTISMSFSNDSDKWKIQAETRQIPDPAALEATGSSRAEALDVVAEAWRERRANIGYPPFDWGAIRDVLAAVRAI
jgi:hypothetical protein